MISEASLRFGVFLAILTAVAVAEALRPRRSRIFSRLVRWPANLGMAAVATIAVRALAFAGAQLSVPALAVVAAAFATERGWGLLPWLNAPRWLSAIIAFVALDFAVWLAHVASHRVPLLWRVHKVHHSDRDFDVATALRFHPVEIVLSMLYKVVWVLALGPTAATVIVFEMALNGLAMFNHSNLELPLWLDRILRILVVTPDMHRVHHSVRASEHNHNFGFNLAIWDRLFRLYTDQPSDGHQAMTIGLPDYQSDAPARLGWSLGLPFRRRGS
jgi:sterol desaturase/sphingolipid hydroxylase (fatty acid hydroxylase superfamily)